MNEVKEEYKPIRKRQALAHRAWEEDHNRETAVELVAAYAGDGVGYPWVKAEDLAHELWVEHSTRRFVNWWSVNANVDEAVEFLRDCVRDDLSHLIAASERDEEDWRYIENQTLIADGHGLSDKQQADFDAACAETMRLRRLLDAA